MTDEWIDVDVSTVELGRLYAIADEALGETVLGHAVRRRLIETEAGGGGLGMSTSIAGFQDSI